MDHKNMLVTITLLWLYLSIQIYKSGAFNMVWPTFYYIRQVRFLCTYSLTLFKKKRQDCLCARPNENSQFLNKECPVSTAAIFSDVRKERKITGRLLARLKITAKRKGFCCICLKNKGLVKQHKRGVQSEPFCTLLLASPSQRKRHPDIIKRKLLTSLNVGQYLLVFILRFQVQLCVIYQFWFKQ